MKILLTESQYKTILEQEQEVLEIPSVDLFGGWDGLQVYLERKGNPPYSIGGDLDLSRTPIKSLGNLQSVGGDLDLYGAPIKSLGNLSSVGGYFNLTGTPLSKMMTEEEIRNKVEVEGTIFL